MIETYTYEKTTLGQIADNEVFYIENRDRSLSTYMRLGVNETFSDMVNYQRMRMQARVETSVERLEVYRRMLVSETV